MKTLTIVLFFLTSIAAANAQMSTQRDSLAQSATFRTSVKIATINAANNILSDTGYSSYVINFAQIIITQPNGGDWLTSLSYGVVSNPAISESSSDSDIQFTINSIFIKYANAYYKIIQ